jgi:DNA-directed RNA polymerase specialized sigma24 family protein
MDDYILLSGDIMNPILDKIQKQEDAVKCLSFLNREERKIFIEYYIDGKTFKEIASTRNMTGQNIRRKIIQCKEKAKTGFNFSAKLQGLLNNEYT